MVRKLLPPSPSADQEKKDDVTISEEDSGKCKWFVRVCHMTMFPFVCHWVSTGMILVLVSLPVLASTNWPE